LIICQEGFENTKAEGQTTHWPKEKGQTKRIRILSEDEDSDKGEGEERGREAIAEQLGFDSDVEEGEVPSQPAETDYQNLVESEEEEDGM
jgi:hypothetical protein